MLPTRPSSPIDFEQIYRDYHKNVYKISNDLLAFKIPHPVRKHLDSHSIYIDIVDLDTVYLHLLLL